METVEIVKVFGRKVWVESDLMGARHVMVQHDDGQSEPFTYCTFHYCYGYTDNASTYAEAELMARALGATDPIEHRQRLLDVVQFLPGVGDALGGMR